MSRSHPNLISQILRLLGQKTPLLDKTELDQFVRHQLERRERLLEIVKNSGSPLYVIDLESLAEKAIRFKGTFSAVMPDLKIFYALKSNSHPLIASTLVKNGFGLDVSSGLELQAALGYGAGQIIFSGPGKTESELALATDNSDRVMVLLDSFGELERLEDAAAKRSLKINAGVRMTTDESGIWRKFGVPPKRLNEFFEAAGNCTRLRLCGLQFHLSWNLTPESQISFIKRLGEELRLLSAPYRQAIKFIDIGGGFWPEMGEWMQEAATPLGIVKSVLDRLHDSAFRHFRIKASPLKDFASALAEALKKYFPDDMHYTVFTEPGRWLCNEAMFILLTVVDKKAPDLVITDGGTNAVGWERYETDYFPIINLTHPSLVEKECLVAGSLCTPHDIWGYSYFGDSIERGDILLIPSQGAYTYSLRQEFIKPLPKSVELGKWPNSEN
jgi:diaminopimelate decarboxylase